MRRFLSEVEPRTIIVTPDGRVGLYAHRYRREDGVTVGRVLIEERPGETTAVDVDVTATVDVVYCDRQAQEQLWKRIAREAAEPLAYDDGRYALAGDAVWLDAGPLALRVEMAGGGVRLGVFPRGTASTDETAALPLRALYVLAGEV